jgi:hypothetical protein
LCLTVAAPSDDKTHLCQSNGALRDGRTDGRRRFDRT